MYPPSIIAEAAANGLLTGAVYALVALGLTLVYGVLHIINFAHGALLTCAMFAVWGLAAAFSLSPYLAILPLVPLFFALGYALQRFDHRPGQRRPRRQRPSGHSRSGHHFPERPARAVLRRPALAR